MSKHRIKTPLQVQAEEKASGVEKEVWHLIRDRQRGDRYVFTTPVEAAERANLMEATCETLNDQNLTEELTKLSPRGYDVLVPKYGERPTTIL